MSTEAVAVDPGFGVHVCSALDQPACDFQFIKIHADVQQCRARQRRTMQGKRVIRDAAEFRRIDLLMRKSSMKQSGIALKMRFEQIDATAMESHNRCIRERNATGDE